MKSFRKIIVSLVLLGAALFGLRSSSFTQGLQVWTNLGLYGGQIYDIAIDPLNPDRMFVGSYLGDGLFVTSDGGNTWRAVEASNDPPGEATFKNHAVWAVKIAPSDHNVIWAAHDSWVEKSTDGGNTWTHTFNRDMQRDCQNCGGESDDLRFCRSIAIHPSDPDTVYVGTGGPDERAANGAIYKTTDGGITWTKLNGGANFNYSIISIAFDTSNPQIMWAITDSREENGVYWGSLYRSGDGGDTWTRKISVDTAWYDLAIKPDEPNVVFLAT
ncbi:MAG: hypothetical protein H6Q55_3389, partial [Deltaproteobacteria bacterium]|nr:hypothetical protein [Deltaproteobacteria bacterium]